MLSALLGNNPAANDAWVQPAAGHAPLAAQTPDQRAHAPLPSASGHLVQDPDFALPTTAGPLPWRLFYYSDHSQVNSEWGYGRRASWPIRLCAETSGGITTVCLEREDGSGVHYRDAGSGFTPTTPRVFDSLVKNPDGSWDEKRFDTGAVFHYPSGSFTSLAYFQTVLGQTVTMSYQNGLLQTIQEPAGRYLTYSYDANNHVSNVTDWAARVHTFSYYGSGEMAAMEGPNGEVTGFGYDGLHHLTGITDPNGFVTAFTYDDQDRVLTRSVDGNVGTYTYASGYTAYLDPMGHQWGTVADIDGNVTQIGDAVNATRSAKYDSRGLLLSWQDAIGRTTAMTYDASGRQTSVLDAGGGLTLRSFDQFGNLLTEQDPMGRILTYQYYGTDPTKGKTRQRKTAMDVFAHVTTYTYTPWGAVQSVQTPLGLTTNYAWSSLGLMGSQTDPLGNSRFYGYDLAGNLTSETDETGRTLTHTYDLESRRLTTQNMFGAVWTTLYDGVGNVTQQTDPLGHQTLHQYNAYRQETQRTDPRGYLWTTAYDAKGRHVASVDPLGYRTTLQHDWADRNTVHQDTRGNITTTAYDLAQQPLTHQDGLGFTHQTAYDLVGRVNANIDPLFNVTTHTYNAAGQKTAHIQPLGYIHTTSYEPVGRQWSTKTPLNALATVTYDADGRTTAHTDPLGFVTTTQYDNAGRPTATINALGQQSATQYDAAGRPLAMIDPLGHRMTVSYDAAGRELARMDASGHAATLVYDFAGRVQAHQDARGFLTTTLYDSADNPTVLINANGCRTTTAYDPRGMVSATQDALGAWSYVQYDPAGNPSLRTDARGWVTTYGYDGLNRVQGVLYMDGTQETHTYDAAGRQTAMQDSTGTTAYRYDAAGRQTAVAYRSARTLTYVYDGSGNRTLLISPDGTCVTYGYDPAEHLTGIVNGFGERTTITYDALHREQTRTLGSGVIVSHTYDAAGRQTLLENRLPTGAALAVYTAAYDPTGNRTGVWELDGSRVTYLYDAGDQLVDEWRSGTGAYHASYTYDPAGNRLAKGLNKGMSGGLTTYAYNGVNQMTLICPAGASPNVQTYDASGNLVGQNAGGVLSTYTWNGENRLVGASFAGTATAAFVGSDAGTEGNWKGAYGADGFDLSQDGSTGNPHVPAYAAVSVAGNGNYTWAASTTDVRGLLKAAPGGTDRLEACWYSASGPDNSFDINVNLSDGQAHKVSLYCLDEGSTGRTQAVTVRDAATGAVLDTQTLTAFYGGTYLTWAVTGHVVFHVACLVSANAVVSGLFFDTAATAAFVGSDAGTQGNWKGAYGADGFDLSQDASTGNPSIPAYAAITITGNGSYVWDASTSYPGALLKSAPGSTDRLAACWYSASGPDNSFDINVNLSDGQAHRVSLYCVDIGSTGRNQSIVVKDAATGAVLDTQALTSFVGGTYLTWAVTGHVVFHVVCTGGGNAVVSGLFLDAAAMAAVGTGPYTVTYTYDALGHRITRQSTRGLGSQDQSFYTSNPGQWGGLSSHRQYGAGVSRFYGADLSGHTRLVTDGAGLVVASYVHTAFGEPVLSSADATPLRFGGDVGYYRDDDSRLYVRARHLDPANGRWLSQDPIGTEGGLNLYGYVHNNPVNGIDPSGKQLDERIVDRVDVKEIPVSTAFAGIPGINAALLRALTANYRFYQVNLTEFDPITHRTISSVPQFLFAKPIRENLPGNHQPINLAGNYRLAVHDRRADAWINILRTKAYFKGTRNGIGEGTPGDYKDMPYPSDLLPLFTPRTVRIQNQLHKLLDHAGNFNGGMVAQGYGTLWSENEYIGAAAKTLSDYPKTHRLELDDRFGQKIFQAGWTYGSQKDPNSFYTQLTKGKVERGRVRHGNVKH